MGIPEKMWDAITTVIKMNDKIKKKNNYYSEI